MFHKQYHLLLPALLLWLASCQPQPTDVCRVDALPAIYPDYVDVTVPAGIAPLNFTLMDRQQPMTPSSAIACYVVMRSADGDSLVGRGQATAQFDEAEWRALTARHVGQSLSVETYACLDGRWMRYRDFAIHVSPFALDEYGLTYRRFAPGYVLSTDIGIYQRDLHSFSEEAIVRNTELQGHCLGCHTSCRTDSRQFSLHARGKAPATLLRHGGRDLWLKTDTDSTLSKCVYPSWHPSGRYIAYSLNLTHQMFWATGQHNIEVFDVGSDLVVVDADRCRILRSPLVEHTPQWFETFPSFSALGDAIYFSRSPYRDIPADIDSLRYSLCRIAFDAATGTWGDTVTTLIDGDAERVSITFPRPSYDGRWLVYTQTPTGYFSIHHEASDLWLMDLQSGQRRPLTEVNSERAESFCQWNANSRWLVFASRRDDGQYTRLYLTSIDDEGRATKPVLLPQRDPWRYYHESLQSFNTPDFIDARIDLDVHEAFSRLTSGQRTPLEL